jgi:hypothetical protein
MATDLRTIAPYSSADVDSVEEPHLFRFRLRQLLAVVTLICLLLAAVVSSSGLAAAVLLLATLVVVFHIFSTALATQLRSHTDRAIAQRPSAHESDEPTAAASESLSDSMARSPWHDRASTPLPWLPRLVTAASLCGGLLGALVLILTTDRPASPAGIALGSVSIAVVAGWFAFIGYSFFGVFRHGLRQASANDRSNLRH